MPEYLQRESNKITVASFYEGFELGKYNFEPPYQRRSLWTEEKKSFLIDSILKNYPMPPIFLHQKIDDATGKTTYDVIDGKQRLTSIVEFIQDEIPVADESGESVEYSDIAGRFFSEFEIDELSRFKSRFWRYVIPIEYVDTGEQDVIDSIFDRLNRNGEPLVGQELRHSTYYGKPLLNRLEVLSKSEFWTDRLSVVDHSRMEEIEFLSELAFLILEKRELTSNQAALDDLYAQYAESQAVDYGEFEQEFRAVSNFMDRLGLPYGEFKISGVSHLYGLFAFSKRCLDSGIASNAVAARVHDFYSLLRNREFEHDEIRQYKESMSARTKDQGQRRRRTAALMSFCAD